MSPGMSERNKRKRLRTEPALDRAMWDRPRAWLRLSVPVVPSKCGAGIRAVARKRVLYSKWRPVPTRSISESIVEIQQSELVGLAR